STALPFSRQKQTVSSWIQRRLNGRVVTKIGPGLAPYCDAGASRLRKLCRMFSGLLTGRQNSFVDHHSNFDTAVCRSALRCLVRSSWSGNTHCSRRHDVPRRNVPFLHEVINHRIRALFAQTLIGGCVSNRISKSLYFDDVTRELGRLGGKLRESSLVIGSERGFARTEVNLRPSFHFVVGQLLEPAAHFLLIGCDLRFISSDIG